MASIDDEFSSDLTDLPAAGDTEAVQAGGETASRSRWNRW